MTGPALPDTFAALADPARMAMIMLLSKEPRRAGDWAAELGVTAPPR